GVHPVDAEVDDHGQDDQGPCENQDALDVDVAGLVGDLGVRRRVRRREDGPRLLDRPLTLVEAASLLNHDAPPPPPAPAPAPPPRPGPGAGGAGRRRGPRGNGAAQRPPPPTSAATSIQCRRSPCHGKYAGTIIQ